MRRTSISFCLIVFICCMLWSVTCRAQTGVPPKREFRGAWIQTVNGFFKGMPRDQMQATLTRYLDAFKRYGLNTVMFQVRCEADAFYKSSYEPWSYYLTGQQGVAPNPMWDPLEWMVEQCHARGLEIHAWINPYRAKPPRSTIWRPTILTTCGPTGSSSIADSCSSTRANRETGSISAELWPTS